MPMSTFTSGNTRHTCAVPSSDAVTTWVPSGLNEAELIAPVCPSRVTKLGGFALKSHTRAGASLEIPKRPVLVTTCVPSALNDADRTGP